jgi:acetate kinase
MRILVLNPGSATLKFRLLDVSGEETCVVTSGLIDHVAGDSTSHAAAEVVGRCHDQGIEAIGCRVVHGGEQFSAPTRVSAEVRAAIRALGRLAPLHNPIAADVLDGVERALPGVPVVAVFDTAFHRTIPDVAALYALPLEMSRSKGLRRYGAHGTSHQYVAGRLAALASGRRFITCHLGNGASVCAVRDGRSIDTSMGLTPLAGLIMGTRSGDLDPSLVLHLIQAEGMSAPEVDDLLNRRSGLLGVGGFADMRELSEAEAADNDAARLAIEMFAYRVRHFIGAYAAALEGVDAIAFSGGIGEHSAEVRRRICQPLGWLGVRLDGAEASTSNPAEMRVSAADSAVQVWVIPTDEESLIARATADLLSAS